MPIPAFATLPLLLTLSAAMAQPQPAAPTAGVDKHVRMAQERVWPVHIVDSDSHPAGQPPMVVVGSLFTGGHCFREDDAGTIHRTPDGQITLPVRLTANKHSRIAEEYLLGNVRPRPSCNDQETCVFITSPPLNGYDEFRIDTITQEGTRFTVNASHWTDDSGRVWGPGPNHSAQIVRLGWLPAGDYTLQFNLRKRASACGKAFPALSDDKGLNVGQTPFTVTKADAWHYHKWDQPASAAIITQDSLKPASIIPTPGPDVAKYQRPYFSHKRVPSNGAKAEAAATVTITPNLDWHKHSQSSATLWTPIDAAAPTDPKAPPTLVARISGGTPHLLGKYDWADVSAIEWKGTTVTVYINTWRKSYIHGNDRVADIPEFAVPLESAHLDPDPAKAAASIKVEVVWQNGIDNPRNAVEEVRH